MMAVLPQTLNGNIQKPDFSKFIRNKKILTGESTGRVTTPAQESYAERLAMQSVPENIFKPRYNRDGSVTYNNVKYTQDQFNQLMNLQGKTRPMFRNRPEVINTVATPANRYEQVLGGIKDFPLQSQIATQNLKRLDELSSTQPTGLPQDYEDALRKAFETGREQRLLDARERLREVAQEGGRLQSSTTAKELNDLERQYEDAAVGFETKLAMLDAEMRDRQTTEGIAERNQLVNQLMNIYDQINGVKQQQEALRSRESIERDRINAENKNSLWDFGARILSKIF